MRFLCSHFRIFVYKLLNHWLKRSTSQSTSNMVSNNFQPFYTELTHPLGISEWYCPVAPGTGLHPRPGSSESLQFFFPEVNAASWPTLLYPSRKGETIEQVHDRVDTFALAFLPALEQGLPGKHQRLLIITHGATAIALVRTFVGDRGNKMKAGCCTLSVLERKANIDLGVIIGGWKAQKISHADYLTEAIAREWGFDNAKMEQGKVIILTSFFGFSN